MYVGCVCVGGGGGGGVGGGDQAPCFKKVSLTQKWSYHAILPHIQGVANSVYHHTAVAKLTETDSYLWNGEGYNNRAWLLFSSLAHQSLMTEYLERFFDPATPPPPHTHTHVHTPTLTCCQ